MLTRKTLANCFTDSVYQIFRKKIKLWKLQKVSSWLSLEKQTVKLKDHCIPLKYKTKNKRPIFLLCYRVQKERK